MKARCRRFAVSGPVRAMEKQFRLEPMQLRFEETFPRVADRGQRVSQHVQSRLRLAGVLVGLGQQGKEIRPPQLGARGLVGGQTLAYLGNAVLTAPLLGQRPTSQDGSPCKPERKSLLGRERDGGVGALPGQLCLMPQLMQFGGKGQAECEAERMRKPAGQRQRLLGSLAGLSRKALQP
ncbi:hypothetical protein D9M70_153780 [compost metagenome]